MKKKGFENVKKSVKGSGKSKNLRGKDKKKVQHVVLTSSSNTALLSVQMIGFL